jgi:hypothetical protein
MKEKLVFEPSKLPCYPDNLAYENKNAVKFNSTAEAYNYLIEQSRKA